MAAPSYTFTLTNGTTADASQVQQNFADILAGVTDGTKDLSINALTCAGAATFNGNVNVGNASGDDLTITASLASSIPVKTTATYNVGSSTLGLLSLYFGGNSQTTRVMGSGSMSATWTLTLPVSAGSANQILITDGSGVSSWSAITNSNWYATASVAGTVSTTTQTMAGAKTWNDVQTWKASSGATTVGSYDTSGGFTWGPTSSSTATHTAYVQSGRILQYGFGSGAAVINEWANGTTRRLAIGVATATNGFVTGVSANDSFIAANGTLYFSHNDGSDISGMLSTSGGWTLGRNATGAPGHSALTGITSGPSWMVQNLVGSDENAESLRCVKHSTGATADTNVFVRFFVNAGGTASGRISSSGTTPGAAFFGSSDRRLKTDIQPLTGALATVNAMNPVTFLMKDELDSPNPRRRSGFIAQELWEVFPQVVSKTDDGLGETVPEGVEPWSMTETGFATFLVAALKEITARVEVLEVP